MTYFKTVFILVALLHKMTQDVFVKHYAPAASNSKNMFLAKRP